MEQHSVSLIKLINSTSDHKYIENNKGYKYNTLITHGAQHDIDVCLSNCTVISR